MLLVLPYFLAAAAGAAIMGIAVWARARAAQRGYRGFGPAVAIPGHALPRQSRRIAAFSRRHGRLRRSDLHGRSRNLAVHRCHRRRAAPDRASL